MKPQRMRAQPAIEYLLLIGASVVFVTILAYFIKLTLNR